MNVNPIAKKKPYLTSGLKTYLKEVFTIRTFLYVIWKTGDKACYTGQHDPFVMPQCMLYKGNEPAKGTLSLRSDDYQFPTQSVDSILN